MNHRCLKKEAEATQVIEKSKFIAYARPVEDRDSAIAFFDEIKALHRQARHHVPAFIVGLKQKQEWASDDGEPSGTAGMPILRMLSTLELTNSAIIVVRYFGGIKLGTGGLSRAYQSSADLVIKEAGIATAKVYHFWKISIDYSIYNIIVSLASKENFGIENEEFLDKVTLSLTFLPEYEEKIKTLITDISSSNFEEKGSGTFIRYS